MVKDVNIWPMEYVDDPSNKTDRKKCIGRSGSIVEEQCKKEKCDLDD